MEKSQSTSKTEPDIRGLNNLEIRSSIRSPVCSPVFNMLMYQKPVEQMEILIFN